MNDEITAMVASQKPDSPLVPLTLAELKLANEFVTAGRTKELTTAMNGYITAKKKLVTYKEYLYAVWILFQRLPKKATLDGCTSWSRWLEHHFNAQEKNQKDYLNQLVRQQKRENSLLNPATDEPASDEPDTDEPDTDALTAKQISREIVAADYSIEDLEYLAKTIAGELQRKQAISDDFEVDVKKSGLIGYLTLEEKIDAIEEELGELRLKKVQADYPPDVEPVALVVAKQTLKQKRVKKIAATKAPKKTKKQHATGAEFLGGEDLPSVGSDDDRDDEMPHDLPDEDSNPFGYEDCDTDAAIRYAQSSAKPNLDELDGMSE